MARCILSPILILLMVLPARTVAETLFVLVPAPAAPDQTAEDLRPLTRPARSQDAKPVKVCPCTGQPGCNCCGCCDETTENDACPTAPTDEKQPDGKEGERKSDDGSRKCTGCKCKPAVGLASTSDYLSNLRLKAVFLGEPKPENVAVLGELYPSISMPVDAPPPKASSSFSA